jgi:hypothetical protein
VRRLKGSKAQRIQITIPKLEEFLALNYGLWVDGCGGIGLGLSILDTQYPIHIINF